MSKEASLTILDRVDLKRKLAAEEYDQRLEKAQGGSAPRAGRVREEALVRRRLRGWDASGKGGNIRRITAAMDRARTG